MADFFDQMCRVIAETEARRPGSLSPGPEVEALFAAAPRPSPATSAAPAAPRSPEAAPVPAAGTLDALRDMLADCRRCPLARGRTHLVFGEGNPRARLMFIGEGPGFDEDRTGRPFVGRAGQLLDRMIAAMQFTREEVYIANVVKCRPPDNRAPAPEEAACCLPFLKRQIDLVRPEVIVLLGAVAVKYLLDTTTGIMKMRGKWTHYENIPVMPTFHPAFLLRQEAAKREAWQDLQQVMARFGKFHRR
ncbi:MAG: uracil-DNA glycosylase [Lentisphaeria bacterium]|nr:uracil-DNA glycosylase [Lentisphaeria bacterium]